VIGDQAGRASQMQRGEALVGEGEEQTRQTTHDLRGQTSQKDVTESSSDSKMVLKCEPLKTLTAVEEISGLVEEDQQTRWKLTRPTPQQLKKRFHVVECC
jgi:hypothetical protein